MSRMRWLLPLSFVLCLIGSAVLCVGLLYNAQQQQRAQLRQHHQRQAQEHAALLGQQLVRGGAWERSELEVLMQRAQALVPMRYMLLRDMRLDVRYIYGEIAPQDYPPGSDQYDFRPQEHALFLQIPLERDEQTIGVMQIEYVLDDYFQGMWHPIPLWWGLLALLPWLWPLALVWRHHRDIERAYQFVPTLASTPPDTVPPCGALTPLLEGIQAHLTSRTAFKNDDRQGVNDLQTLQVMLHRAGAVLWEADPHTGRFTFVSKEAESLLNLPPERWYCADFIACHVHRSDAFWLSNLLTHKGDPLDNSMSIDFRALRADGSEQWLRIICASTRRQGEQKRINGILMDIDEDQQNRLRAEELAQIDPLTKLLNRRSFQQNLDEYIALYRMTGANGALLLLDIDQFKYINDSFGHQQGDNYLCEMALLLQKHDPQMNTLIGRLGGDEFGIVRQYETVEQLQRYTEQLLHMLAANEFNCDGLSTTFSASVGIALFPQHGEKPSELLARADSAMYGAKESGRNNYRIFELRSDAGKMREKVYWEERIRMALRDEGFVLYYQPIVDLISGKISHYESLLRMRDGDRIVAPGAFIGVAERFGSIRDIDHWVVAQALKVQGHSERSGQPVSLTVNLSGRHFGGKRDSTEILDLINRVTDDAGANPKRIVFEVTETAAVENFDTACRFIEALHQRGYRFALDDFGVGFASFDYLRNIPVDLVKIDGSFVRNLDTNEVDRIFVGAITEMARGLGVRTVGEFVENHETVLQLRRLQVNYGQGYFFSKPREAFITSGEIDIAPPSTVDMS